MIVLRKSAKRIRSDQPASSARNSKTSSSSRESPPGATDDSRSLRSKSSTVINLASAENPDGMNVTIRGLLPAGVEMRRNVHIVSGRWFEAGHREVVVGISVAATLPRRARWGKGIRIGHAAGSRGRSSA